MRKLILLAIVFAVLTPNTAIARGEPDFTNMAPDYDVDVCVLGGGPSGTAAAIAAARNGADTMLIEQYGYLGGMGTAGLVSVFMSYKYAGGIFREILHRLDKQAARRGSSFDPNLMRVVLDNMATEAGVKLLFHTRGIACNRAIGSLWQGKERRTITGLVIHNKSGIQLVRARVYIDCTGDGDLAKWAGATYHLGRVEDHAMQPMTMIFTLGGCEYKGGPLSKWPGMEDYWASYCYDPNPGEITLNMTRISGYSGVSGHDLSEATVKGRQEVMKAIQVLRENVPGFENAYLVRMPTQIGVRETRHIVGATQLTGDQIIDPGIVYDNRYDVIARNDYMVDIHDPKGTGAKIIRIKQPYGIPYRCLLPKRVDNLLIAGRPISADHVAHSSLRIQPTCYALGQAAGTAAAIAVANDTGPWEVGQSSDPTKGQPLFAQLQKTLIQQGADLGPVCARRLGLYDEWQRWQLKYRVQAFPIKRDFDDVPEDHIAHDAVENLVRLGVFRGLSQTHYGADEIATISVTAVVLARCCAVLPANFTPDLEPVQLPDRLKGQWWSSGLEACASRGIITKDELADLDPDAPTTEPMLLRYLERTLPTMEVETTVPESLLRDGAVTRAGLAYAVWRAIAPIGQ